MIESDFDLGGVFAFVLASAMSVFTAGLLVGKGSLGDPVWSALFIGGTVAAWVGFWAWRRQTWLLSAGMFFLTLAWPGGFGVELTIPFAFGLFVVSLIRAWSARRARRKPLQLAAGGR